MMISKEEFDSLYDENILKKEYDRIIAKVDDRFGEICEKFLKMQPNKGWFTYGNCCYDDESDEGFFDIDEFKEEISIGGEHIDPPIGFTLSIPTRWLWEENFEEEIKKTTQDFLDKIKKEKEDAKNKREKRKEELASLKKSIKAKLTKEELKAITFKV